MPSYEVVIPITSKFHWELNPFCYLFKKFWFGQSIIILSDKNPDLPEISFIKTEHSYNGEWHNHFSDALIGFLKNDCQSDFVILLMADFWLIKKVDQYLINSLASYMSKHNNVLYCDMARPIRNDPKNKPAFNFVESWNKLTYWNCPIHQRDCFLRAALVPAMWQTKLLLELLNTGWGLWETELNLSHKVKTNPGIETYLVSPLLLEYKQLAFSRAKSIDLRNFSEDIRMMIPSGFTINE